MYQTTEKTMLEHINDFTKVLIFNFVFMFIVFLLAFPLSEIFLRWAISQYSFPLYAYSLMENINVTLITAFTFAILISIPVFIINLIKYAEIKISYKYYLLGFGMYTVGIAGFIIGFSYLSSYMATQILEYQLVQTAVSLSSTLYFALINGFIIAVSFELLFIIPILTKIGIIQYENIKKARPYLFVAILCIVAWVTPSTDILSMTIMTIPTYGGYEGGLQISRFFGDTKNGIRNN